MTAEEFVRAVKEEKDNTVAMYFSDTSETQVGQMIRELEKNGAPKEKIHALVDAVLNENCYTLLLAIDGEASLGNIQQQYKLLDEEGSELTGSGEIESEAFEQFMSE